MKYTAIFIAALLVSSAAFCETRKQSEDPSYEPMRESTGKPSTKTTAPAPAASSKVYAAQPPAEIQATSGPRVKYILNGQPVYEGDPSVPGIDDKNIPGSSNKKKDSKADRVPSQEVVTPSVSQSPVQYEAQSGPRVKYILDGKPVYEGEEPRDAVVIQQSTTVAPQATFTEAPPAPRQTVSIIEDDLTADKPGSAAAAETNPVLLEEFIPGDHLNTRAKQCYMYLSLLKKNVETVSRCLDNRGKENARLIHSSDEMSKNITQLADIWSNSRDYIDRCTITKRYSLLFSDELSRTPWKWAQVRWSFDTFLKDVRTFREYAKEMADHELKQQPRRLKDGTMIWEDVPDPVTDQLAAKQEEKHKADREALSNLRKGAEVRSDATKNRMDTDLRNAR